MAEKNYYDILGVKKKTPQTLISKKNTASLFVSIIPMSVIIQTLIIKLQK